MMTDKEFRENEATAGAARKLLLLRCSSMPQFMTCAPSELNPEKFQEVHLEIEPAELGTLVHDFAERIVKTAEYSVEELKARRPQDMERAELLIRNFYTVWEEAKQALDHPQTELYREATLVENDAVKIVLTGHIDLCQVGPNSALILDYKTGRLHDNHYHQIAGYSFLLWDYAGRPDNFTVSVSVVYLEDLSITNYSFTADELRKWQAEVIAKTSDTRYTVGKKCAFCKIQGSCPAYREYTQAAIRFFQSDDAQKGRVAWTEAEPDERGSLVDVMYVVKKGAERVTDSLKAALQGKKGEASLDLGGGTVYTKIVRKDKVLKVEKALPILRDRFKQELIDDITTIKLSDVLDLVAQFAPPRGKGKAKAEFLDKLTAAGAVVEVQNERFERRNATEQKLGTLEA